METWETWDSWTEVPASTIWTLNPLRPDDDKVSSAGGSTEPDEAPDPREDETVCLTAERVSWSDKRGSWTDERGSGTDERGSTD